MIQTVRKKIAGARNAAVIPSCRSRLRGATGGAARTGGSAVTLAPLTYLPYAFLAAASSFAAVPLTFFGFETKSWNSFHSPWPVVEPNDAGCRSDMSNRKIFACARASAVFRFSGSLYAEAVTPRFGEAK